MAALSTVHLPLHFGPRIPPKSGRARARTLQALAKVSAPKSSLVRESRVISVGAQSWKSSALLQFRQFGFSSRHLKFSSSHEGVHARAGRPPSRKIVEEEDDDEDEDEDDDDDFEDEDEYDNEDDLIVPGDGTQSLSEVLKTKQRDGSWLWEGRGGQAGVRSRPGGMGSRASSEPLSSLLDMNMDELDRLVEEEDGERVGKGPWGMRGRGRSSDSVIVGDMDDLTDSEVIMAIGADGEQLFSGGGVGHSHPGGVHGRDSPSWLGLFNGKYPVIVDFDYDMSNDDDDDEDEPNPAVAWVKMQRQFDELEAQLGGVTEEWLNSRQDPDRIMAEKDPLTHVVIHPRAEHEAQQAVVDLWETHLEEQRQWSPEKRALMGVEAASEPGEEDAAVEASLELDADMEEWEVDALREKARTAYRVERARAAAAVTAQATAAAASPMGAMSASAVQAAGDDVSAALLVPPSVAGGDALMAGEAEVVDGVAAAGTGVTVAPMHAEEDETAALNRLLFTRTVKSDVMAMRSCFDASRDVRLKDSFDTRVYTEEEVRAFIGQVPISPKAFRIQRDSLRANYRLIRPYKGDFEEFLEQEGRFMDDERDTAAPSLLEGNDDMLSMDFTDFEKDVVSKALDIGDDEDDEDEDKDDDDLDLGGSDSPQMGGSLGDLENDL
eukprot:jgi/Mesvir1/8367/Mv12618-RA.2